MKSAFYFKTLCRCEKSINIISFKVFRVLKKLQTKLEWLLVRREKN